MVFLPDEVRSLPPPAIVNKNSVWLGLLGWCASIADNLFNRRPPVRAGVHRQVLWATLGWVAGYYLLKRENYVYAKHDQEMMDYIRRHPEDFKEGERKKIGELLEDFHPIR
uniref:NADH dehydrogenase [ubiquinone] 1 subunit C2 n=1 Tax=Pelusios castaneus TaxID=367368 RepID=A0A8C8RQ12_9SAUR